MVEAAGIGKVFGAGDGAVTALESVDLAIRQGEFVSLIGPSGCGKSTLLRIIGDLTQPTTGSISINGKPAARARLDRDYGMVFQAPVLMDWRTVDQEHRAAARDHGLPSRGAPPSRRRPAQARRVGGVRGAPSLGTVGRDAATRGDRPGPLVRPEAAADGRTVRCSRRDDPRADERRTDEHLAADRDDDRVRHPQHPGGGLPVDPRHGHVGATRTDLAGRRHRPAARTGRSRRASPSATSAWSPASARPSARTNRPASADGRAMPSASGPRASR